MSTDFVKGLRKTIDLSVRSKEFTVDTLKSAMQDFLSGKSQRKGRVAMKKLSEHSGKLENVEIKGIGDFLSVAKKYDIGYMLSRKKQTVIPFMFSFRQAKWKISGGLFRSLQAENKRNFSIPVLKLPDNRSKIWQSRFLMSQRRKKKSVRSLRK